MDNFFSLNTIVGILCGFSIGCFVTWFLGRNSNIPQDTAEIEQDNMALQEEIQNLKIALATESRIYEERLRAYEQAEKTMTETFQSLAGQALKSNMDSFFQVAKSSFDRLHALSQNDLKERQGSIGEMLNPFKERLKSMDDKLADLEKSRITAYTSIQHQIKEMMREQDKLHHETASLSKALRLPSVKGRWGEVQLRRLVELSGMLPHCDFVEQPQVESSEGQRFRPDMIIHLPQGKQIILDSKVPIKAYLEALDFHDEAAKSASLKAYVKHLKLHIKDLSSKAYWQQFDKAPEFVILFLPADPFLSTALEQEPSLMEEAFSQNIVLATPATLMAILQSMAFGWQQATMAEKIQEIRATGQAFYQKFTLLGDEMEKLGRQLRLSVKSYNSSVDTLNDQLNPLAKKLGEALGKDGSALKKPSPVGTMPASKKTVQDDDAA